MVGEYRQLLLTQTASIIIGQGYVNNDDDDNNNNDNSNNNNNNNNSDSDNNNNNNCIESANQDFLHTPHCSASVSNTYAQEAQVQSSAHRAVIKCNTSCAMWYKGTAHLLSLTEPLTDTAPLA